jgi:hypothetical protein
MNGEREGREDGRGVGNEETILADLKYLSSQTNM